MNHGCTHFERPDYIRGYFATVRLVLVRLQLLKKVLKLDEVRVRFDPYLNRILWQNQDQEKMQWDGDLAQNRAYEAEVVVYYFEQLVDTFVRQVVWAFA